MRALVMPPARRLGLFLLLLACAPLIMPSSAMAGGALQGNSEGVAFHDLNHNGVQDSDEPGLIGWTIHLFDTATLALVQTVVTVSADLGTIPPTPDGFYSFNLSPGSYTACEELQAGWQQTAPLVVPPPVGETLALCALFGAANGLTLGPRGYHFTLLGGEVFPDNDFGNFQGEAPPTMSAIRGVAFNDLNGNGVRDPGEQGLPGLPIYLVEDRTVLQSQPGPVIRATIKVDRHARRRPGEPPSPFTTTTGGRVTIVLTYGSLKAEAAFNVGIGFLQGCPPNSEISNEVELSSGGGYIPISEYGLPSGDLLAKLFAKLGVAIDPPAYFPVIERVVQRRCEPDPNPANGASAGVTNPGFLVVDVEIGFRSRESDKGVVASTTTNVSGEYEFILPSGTYTVCESLPPGSAQTSPVAGPTRVNCTGSSPSFGLRGPRGYAVSLRGPGDVANHIDFGNTPFETNGSLFTTLRDAQVWLGLKSSDDQGTHFDVKVELLRNGTVLASGLRRCVTGLTRNPALARHISVAWDDFDPFGLTFEEVLKVSTRIGTNSDGTKCGASHNGARGLRLYYNAVTRPSRFDLTSVTGFNLPAYLDSNGTACPAGGADTANVTGRTLTFFTPPTAPAPKCKDSSDIKFGGGNPFKELGTWRFFQ